MVGTIRSSGGGARQPNVGVLALQGCVQPHIEKLAQLGATPKAVRTKEDLRDLHAIILPGGESTTMLRLLGRNGFFEALKAFTQTHPTWGICAGAILLAGEVTFPKQHSLGTMDIRAERNYYGSQIESFKTTLTIPEISPGKVSADFIRAPLLTPLSDSVKILATHENQTVLLRQGDRLASAFHVELDSELSLHQFFLGFLKC